MHMGRQASHHPMQTAVCSSSAVQQAPSGPIAKLSKNAHTKGYCNCFLIHISSRHLRMFDLGCSFRCALLVLRAPVELPSAAYAMEVSDL